jgi:hypothetical protein
MSTNQVTTVIRFSVKYDAEKVKRYTRYDNPHDWLKLAICDMVSDMSMGAELVNEPELHDFDSSVSDGNEPSK